MKKNAYLNINEAKRAACADEIRALWVPQCGKIDMLHAEDAAALLALIKARSFFGSRVLSALRGPLPWDGQLGCRLSPRDEYDCELVTRLWSLGFINPSPLSDSHHVWIESGRLTADVLSARFELCLDPSDAEEKIRKRLAEIEKNNPECMTVTILGVEVEACLAYYQTCARERGLNDEVEENFCSVCLDLLEKNQKEQIWALIYSAFKYASDLIVKNGLSKKRALSTIPGSMKRHYELVLSKCQEISRFERTDFNPVSAIEVVLNIK